MHCEQTLFTHSIQLIFLEERKKDEQETVNELFGMQTHTHTQNIKFI